jgi:hypothetical protein
MAVFMFVFWKGVVRMDEEDERRERERAKRKDKGYEAERRREDEVRDDEPDVGVDRKTTKDHPR